MDRQTACKWLLVGILTVMKLARAYYQHKAGGAGFKDARKRDPWDLPLLLLAALPLSAATGCWLLYPGPIAFADHPAPPWHGLAGAAVSLLGLALYLWTHLALDENFSFLLRIKKDHALIDHGPYRWVRHPMYTSVLILGLGVSLMSSNWLIAATWLGAFGMFLSCRARKEEAMLLEHFGARYRAYMLRTGRLLPWL